MVPVLEINSLIVGSEPLWDIISQLGVCLHGI